MHFTFLILGGLMTVSALAAVLLRKLVHSVLCLTVTFAGLAALYLQLGAEFVGFVQILVYVGAVAILLVFAILLTRNSDASVDASLAAPNWLIGVAIAALVFGCLAISIWYSSVPRSLPAPPELTVRLIGEKFMAEYVLPLEVAGLLFTAAMIGAVVLAMEEEKRGDESGREATE